MKQSFSGQRPNEHVEFVFRRHIVALRKGFLMLLAPIAIGFIPVLIWPANVALWWVGLAGLVVGLGSFLHYWSCWYFSVYIVTNQRVRVSTQRGMFGRSVIDLGLAKVQNISYNIPGIAGEIFGFGTIVLQTYVGDLVIDKVGHVDDIYNRLGEAIDAAGGRSDGLEEESIDDGLDDEDLDGEHASRRSERNPLEIRDEDIEEIE